MAKISTAKTDLIDAAVSLFRTRGYEGVGVAELLETAGAPRGSLYFHFPGGKEQIGVEAVRRVGEEATAEFQALAASRVDMNGFIDRVFAAVAERAADREYADCCPLVAIAADVSSAHPDLGAAVRAALASWEDEVRKAALKRDMSEANAADFASAFIASMEGATVMAKAHGSSTSFVTSAKAMKALAASLV